MGFKKLSDADKELLREACNDKNYKNAEDSQAIVKASWYLIKKYFQETLRCNQIGWEDFKNLFLDKEIIYTPKNEKKSWQKIEQEYNQKQYNDQNTRVSIDIIKEWNDNGYIRACDISYKTLGKCLGTQKAIRGVKQKVIEAYCSVLDVDYNDLSIAQSTRSGDHPIESQDKASKLEQVLVERFNYKDAIQKIYNLAIEPKRVGIFQFEYQVEKSELNYQVKIPRVWLYKRIKYEIRRLYGSRYKIREIPIIDLADSLKDWNDSTFWYHIGGELGLHQTSLNEVLRKENILIVVENVDKRSEEDLRAIVNKFRKDFVEQIEPMEQGGFCLMLWIDYGKKADWKKGGDFLLDSDICLLPIPDKFKKEDFRCVLRPLAQMFRQRELLDDPTVIEQLWDNTEQGNPQKTLESFYRKFNCKFKSSEAKWTKWT